MRVGATPVRRGEDRPVGRVGLVTRDTPLLLREGLEVVPFHLRLGAQNLSLVGLRIVLVELLVHVGRGLPATRTEEVALADLLQQSR